MTDIKIPYPQIINELSFQSAVSQSDFVLQMKTLYNLICEMANVGFGRMAAFSQSLYDRVCFDQTTFYQWLRLPCKDAEEHQLKTALRSLFSKLPFLEDSISPDEQEDDLFFQGNQLYPVVTADGRRIVPGLAASYIFSLPSISCQVAEYAENTNFELTVRSMDKNGNFEETSCRLISLSTKESVGLIIDGIRKKILKEIRTGADILALSRDGDFFPYLKFSETAESQLKSLSPATTNGFSWFCETLLKLNHAVHKLRSADETDLFDFLEPCSVARCESAVTQNDTKCRIAHTFLWDDHKSRICFSHAKNKSLNLRIYFCYDNTDKTVYVGHIGGHLPTVTVKH